MRERERKKKRKGKRNHERAGQASRVERGLGNEGQFGSVWASDDDDEKKPHLPSEGSWEHMQWSEPDTTTPRSGSGLGSTDSKPRAGIRDVIAPACRVGDGDGFRRCSHTLRPRLPIKVKRAVTKGTALAYCLDNDGKVQDYGRAEPTRERGWRDPDNPVDQETSRIRRVYEMPPCIARKHMQPRPADQRRTDETHPNSTAFSEPREFKPQ